MCLVIWKAEQFFLIFNATNFHGKYNIASSMHYNARLQPYSASRLGGSSICNKKKKCDLNITRDGNT